MSSRYEQEGMHEGVPLIRTSTRTSFTECQQRWEWNWLWGLQGADPSMPLTFGSAIHQAFEFWYVSGFDRGEHPATTFLQVWDAEMDKHDVQGVSPDDPWLQHRELGVALMEDYVKKYGEEPALEIVAIEQPFEILLVDAETDEPVCIYCGTFDGLAYDHNAGCYVCLEHKTTAAISKSHLALDEQANTYWALAEFWLQDWVDGGAELHHILYNFLRKGKRDERPTNAMGQALNKDGTVSKRQPIPRFDRERVFRGQEDRYRVLQRISKQVIAMEAFRNGELPLYKSPGNALNDRCSFCPFSGACELEEVGGDWEEMLELTTEEWDPFDPHLGNLEGLSLDDLTVAYTN